MDDERLDLSALDPSRDSARWDRLVTSIAERAAGKRREQLTMTHQLMVWARPVLAIAAALALVSWCGAWAHGTTHTAPATRVEQPESVLSRWAASGGQPSAARMLSVLGGSDGK